MNSNVLQFTSIKQLSFYGRLQVDYKIVYSKKCSNNIQTYMLKRVGE